LCVGIRTLFYRFAFLSGQGLLVILAGQLEESSGNISFAWMVTFFILAGLLVLFAIYHLIILPKPKSDEKRNQLQLKNLMFNSLKTFTAFFKKKNILLILLFILFYRF